MEADGYWLDEYTGMDARVSFLMQQEADRRTRSIEAAVRAELAAAFREDRDARPVALWWGPLPAGLGISMMMHEETTIELAPEDQARLYL